MTNTNTPPGQATRALLIRRQGLAFLEPAPQGHGSTPAMVRGAELELGHLGAVVSPSLRNALLAASPPDLAAWVSLACDVLARRAGGNVQHVPLFRAFPDGIPDDTTELWWRKVLSHFCQGKDQPCIFCGRVGETHVLSPCNHVVCGQCFDGSNLSACPVCERHLTPGQAFILPSEERPLPVEKVRFLRLDLGTDLVASARSLFVSFALRTQPMSPVDLADLRALAREAGSAVLVWLPPVVPVKENRAHVFATLLSSLGAAAVVDAARPHLSTATDVLRLVAALSGADPSLQGQERWANLAPGGNGLVLTRQNVKRFSVIRMPRVLRRALLGLLEGMDADHLMEDMLRHRSYWVWLGQHLHPHEYAARFPKVARAFLGVRGKAPDGTPAPEFVGFAGRAERALSSGSGLEVTRVLGARPGELGRRLDHALRMTSADEAGTRAVVEAFVARVDRLTTPMLLTLSAHLPLRLAPQEVRVYWPKGLVNRGIRQADRRTPLSSDAITRCVAAITGELLQRFSRKAPLETALIDDALRDIMVPFNERTASRSAVSLPRGSRLAIPPGKALRLFCHWCEPEKRGHETDLDLSVGFYDDHWNHTGVCSFYQLKVRREDEQVAVSSGDIRDAPFPHGGSEFVDVDLQAARRVGFRYAVMVVNNYDGMAFGELERAFAGVMLREDLGGAHFDPRTVALRFDLQGDNGAFLPLVVDLADNTLTWLDAYARGEFDFNTVATTHRAIVRLCPSQMAYFRSGTRPSMRDLALLHAAARCRRVLLRGEDGLRELVRGDGEDAVAFLARLRRGEGASTTVSLEGPVLAALLHGDVELPAGSTAYALFREQLTRVVSAADLLA